MAKQGMKRIERTHSKPRNDVPPVPEIQGKAKHGKAQANPVITSTQPPGQKVYHGTAHELRERPVASVYKQIETDLARDNLENDISKADLEDM